MTCQKILIHHRPKVLPLWSQLTRRLCHRKVKILQKKVICGLSNMRSAHQNSMKSSSRHNSKATLICISRSSTTTSRFVSMRVIDSKKTFLLLTSPSKDTLSLNNYLSHIMITIPILGIIRPTITLDTYCLWK